MVFPARSLTCEYSVSLLPHTTRHCGAVSTLPPFFPSRVSTLLLPGMSTQAHSPPSWTPRTVFHSAFRTLLGLHWEAVDNSSKPRFQARPLPAEPPHKVRNTAHLGTQPSIIWVQCTFTCVTWPAFFPQSNQITFLSTPQYPLLVHQKSFYHIILWVCGGKAHVCTGVKGQVEGVGSLFHPVCPWDGFDGKSHWHSLNSFSVAVIEHHRNDFMLEGETQDSGG